MAGPRPSGADRVPLNDHEASVLVAARLGREPQDALEAAVALEAWGGLPAEEALACALRVVAAIDPTAPRPTPLHALAVSDQSFAIGDVGFVFGVLFTGFWVSRLAVELGDRGVDRAWRIALPLSLGIQWFFRRRYLSSPDGLGRLRSHAQTVFAPLVLLLGAIGILIRPGGWLAAGLTIVWVGGFVLAQRGWGLGFGASLVAGALVLKVGIAAPTLVAIAVVAVICAAAIALSTVRSSPRRPGSAARALTAGLVGAGLGLLLVVEPRFPWNARGALPALTVVPSLLGSLWGGFHMARLWDVMPQVLVTTTVRKRHEGTAGRLMMRLLVESIARLLLGAGLISLCVMAWVWFDGAVTGPDRRIFISLLVAHGVLAVAGLCVALLEAFGRWAWAIVSVAAGVLVALSLGRWAYELTPGVRITWGAIAALAMALGPLLALLREPDRNLAAGL